MKDFLNKNTEAFAENNKEGSLIFLVDCVENQKTTFQKESFNTPFIFAEEI